MPSSVRKHVPQPTRKTEYAREAGESAHPDLWDGLAGAWSPGLGSTGDTLFDLSKNGNDGTLTAMAHTDRYAVDGGRTSLFFTAITNYISIGDRSYDIANSYSLSAWVRRTVTGTQDAIIGRDDSVADRFWQFRFDSDNTVNFIRFDSTDSVVANFKTVATYSSSEWLMVTATFTSGSGSKIYVNGVEKATDGTTTANKTGTGTAIALSARSPEQSAGEPFVGHMDDAFIYERALHAVEVKKLYNLGRGGIFEPKQVEYYLAPSAALDQTRMSTFNIGMPWRSGSMVNPLDTGFTAANRQASGFMYAGILAQAPGGATLPPLLEGNMLIGGFQNMSGGL